MPKNRVALIGSGVIARGGHIPCLRLCGDELAIIIDPDLSALKRAQALAPKAELRQSINEGDWNGIHCAILCTPPTLHAEQAQYFLSKGISVLCEKPLTPSEKESSALAELAKAHKVYLQAGYWRRYQATFSALKQLLHSRELGKLQSVDIVAGHVFHEFPPSLLSPALSGGGCVMDFGVHVFDFLLGLSEALELNQYRDDARGGLESDAEISMTMQCNEQKIPILIRLSRTRPLGYCIKWLFEKAKVTQDLNVGESLTITSSSQTFVMGQTLAHESKLILGEPLSYLGYFEKQWNEFCDGMQGKAIGVANITHAIRASALAEQCYATRGLYENSWGL